MASRIFASPPSSHIAAVLKFVWQPAPFQSPARPHPVRLRRQGRQGETGGGLGVEGDGDAELLGDAVEEVPGEPERVRGLHAQDGARLELPLTRHHLKGTTLCPSLLPKRKGREHLPIGPPDVEPSVLAGEEVAVADVPPHGVPRPCPPSHSHQVTGQERRLGACGAVEGALGCRESLRGEPIRAPVSPHQRVLLLEAKGWRLRSRRLVRLHPVAFPLPE